MSSKTKKKISEMSVEEFMECGLDSDLSDDEKDRPKKMMKKPKKPLKQKQLLSESSAHKKQIERLKDKDPEFYKFLQENDEDLLEFSASDDDDDNGNIDDDVTNKTNKTEIQDSDIEEDKDDDAGGDDDDDDDNEEEHSEDDEEGVEGDSELQVPAGKIVTSKMIDKWKESVEKGSLKTLKTVFRAFHSAVENLSPNNGTDEETTNQKTSKHTYVVEGGSLFNSLVSLCFKHGIGVLDNHLNYNQNKKTKRIPLPTSSTLWSKVKASVKQYLMDILQLLRQLTDSTVLSITLRHCQTLAPYYACFPKITKMLLKRLVRMWSSGDEHVRVLAFLSIRKLTMLVPNLLDFSLKNLYLAFVRNSKFVNLKSKPLVMFMRNSLVEMFALNEAITYKHAFVYIRQLAIHLRNAITLKKKDGYQAVYNWQYVSCLLLWVHALSDLYGDTLKPLVYPVVQITLGVIRLIPSAKYYPLRFQCLDALNYLSEKTGVYIPIASYVLEAIESKEFLKKPKSSEKPPDFIGVLKLSKSQLQTKGFQDVAIDNSFECLMQHYVTLSHSIAFPELIFPICHRLKHLIKNSKVFKLNKDMKSLVDKLKSHADVVTKARSKVSFSPKDVETVHAWEEQQKETKNGLSEFYEGWKRMKTVTESKDEEPLATMLPVGKKRKNEPTVKGGKKRKNEPTAKDGKKPLGRTKKMKNNSLPGSNAGRGSGNQEDDIVEDFQLSSDDGSDDSE